MHNYLGACWCMLLFDFLRMCVLVMLHSYRLVFNVIEQGLLFDIDNILVSVIGNMF